MPFYAGFKTFFISPAHTPKIFFCGVLLLICVKDTLTGALKLRDCGHGGFQTHEAGCWGNYDSRLEVVA
jgi:hypothetical protein